MHTVVTAAAKGGVGKSTIAAAICTAAPLTGGTERVGLVDLDPQGSATGWWNARDRAEPALLEAGGAPLTEVTRQARDTGLDLLVLDCPPGFSSILEEAIGVADLVLIPTGPSAMDLSAVEATADMAEEAGRPYRFVLNRAPFRSRLAGRAVTALLARGRLLMPPVHHRVAIAEAMAAGLTALETEPEGAAAMELLWLWYAVRAELGGHPVRLRPEDLTHGQRR